MTDYWKIKALLVNKTLSAKAIFKMTKPISDFPLLYNALLETINLTLGIGVE